MKSTCPLCGKKTKEEVLQYGIEYKITYLGVIIEKETYKLFKCSNIKGRHKKILYYKESKKDGEQKILFTADLNLQSRSNSYTNLVNTNNDSLEETTSFEYKINYENEKKVLLRSRLKCPKHNEHINTSKDHEYKYVVATGNSNRFYCRNHKGIKSSKHNRYEFRFNAIKKGQTSLKQLLLGIDVDYYNRLQRIYNQKGEKYDIHEDSERLIESLTVIGMSDSIIGRIFHVDRATIYRLKKKKEYKQKYTIQLIMNDKSNRLFYNRMKQLNDKEVKKIYTLLRNIKIIVMVKKLRVGRVQKNH